MGRFYAEAATRRRMMSISTHDRIVGRPSRVKALEDFITYTQKQPGVVFMRKDELARFALESPLTPRKAASEVDGARSPGDGVQGPRAHFRAGCRICEGVPAPDRFDITRENNLGS